jgi:antitoxin (DNA-binding transcriptional repressor) of toxin-antitoxin stability system
MNGKTIKKIGSRELLRNMKGVKQAVAKGIEYEVYDRTNPIFRIVPITANQNKKYTFADLSAFQFSTDDPNLSKRVDDIVYGG